MVLPSVSLFLISVYVQHDMPHDMQNFRAGVKGAGAHVRYVFCAFSSRRALVSNNRKNVCNEESPFHDRMRRRRRALRPESHELAFQHRRRSRHSCHTHRVFIAQGTRWGDGVALSYLLLLHSVYSVCCLRGGWVATENKQAFGAGDLQIYLLA